MRVLVIDVAAEYGGALSILNQFIDEFKKDSANKYIIVLSTIHYKDCNNIKYVNCTWVKKSLWHRLFFDSVYVKFLAKKYKPDCVFSLQNKAVAIRSIPQDVYFQNALGIADKKFSFFESKYLWFYQNIIGTLTKHSLRSVSKVYVQASWIKDALVKKWGIDSKKIEVKKPQCDSSFTIEVAGDQKVDQLFYPANAQIYKNHITLLKALKTIWDSEHQEKPIRLVLTCEKEKLSIECQAIIDSGNYPIEFIGHISKEKMCAYYLSSILVFPSYLETVGLPLIEAKGLKRKIIASNLAYAREALEEYEQVVFFPYDDYKNLAKIIRGMLN